MTLSESIFWSLSRSVIVASIAIWPMTILLRTINDSPAVRSRRLWLAMSVFPFFVPELLIGFNYRLTATQLSSGASPFVASICTELLYSLLQLARCIAVGVAVSMMLPRTEVTSESQYAWSLLRPSLSRWQWRKGQIRLLFAGPWQTGIISWSLMALLTFQEFETAALMQIDRHPIAWSVWLFDAHAARQSLTDSMRMILRPLLCELLLLSPAILLLTVFRSRTNGSSFAFAEDSSGANTVKLGRRFAAILSVSPGLILLLVWPIAANVQTTASGLVAMLKSGSLLLQASEQILTSVGFAIGATLLAMNDAFAICQTNEQTREPILRRVTMLLALSGLLGSLVLSLSLLALFQLPLMHTFYDSWLPMLIGQTLAVLPRAIAIVLLLRQVTDSSAIHSAQLLAYSKDRSVRTTALSIVWRLTTARWLLGGMVIAHWCFWDVTVASILRPVQLEPVVTRLYNEMHYGRTEALMSLSVLAAAAPFVVCFTIALASFVRAMLFHRATKDTIF